MSYHTTVFSNALRFLGFQKLLADRSEVEYLRKENAKLKEDLLLMEQLSETIAQKMHEANRQSFRLVEAERERDRALIRAASAEDTTKSMGEELREQVELNEELIAQRSMTEIQMQGHSSMVDAQRVQVLTQFTMRSLDLRHGLLNALLSPFAMNVAKHLIAKLQGAGALKEGQSAQEVSPLVLLRKPVLELEIVTSDETKW